MDERTRGAYSSHAAEFALQHLPRADLFDAVLRLRELLRDGGRMLVSIPVERPGIDPSGRDGFGRLFTGLHAGELELLCQRAGFRTVDRWTSPDGLDRDGIRWATLLFELAHSAAR